MKDQLAIERTEAALKERMKELHCLYAIQRDMTAGYTEEALYRRVVEHLVPAMQFPEITVPVLIAGEQRYTVAEDTEGLSHGLHAEIKPGGEAFGTLSVYYTREEPFLIPEEQDLLDDIAARLGDWLVAQAAQRRLWSNEQMFRAMIEGGTDLITLLDIDGAIRYVSPSVERIMGYRQPELAGTNAFDYMHPDDVARVRMLFERAAGNPGERYAAEFRLRHRNRTWHTLEGTGGLLAGDSEEAVLLVNARDVTDLLRHSREIRELARFSDENPNPVLHISAEGTLLYANQRGKQLLSSFSGGIGKPLPPTLQELAQEAFQAGERIEREIFLGGRILSLVLLPVPEEGYVNIFGQDITARIVSDRQIRFQADLLDQVGQAVVASQRDGVITYMNPAAERLLGWDAPEAVGQKIGEIFAAGISKKRHLEIAKRLAAGKTWRGERRVQTRDGDWIPVEISFSPIRDMAGEHIGTIGIAQDITERVRAEAAVLARSEELNALFNYSRSLAVTDDLEDALDLLVRRAAELTHSTYAAVALWERGELVLRAAHPIRILKDHLKPGSSAALDDLTCFGRVFLSDEPAILRVEDAELSEIERSMFLPDLVTTLCLVPLSTGGLPPDRKRPLGLLVIGEVRAESREPFDEKKLRLARSLGDQAAVTIRRMALTEETQRHLRRLAALTEIDRAIISGLDIRHTVRIILEQLTTELDFDAAAVLRLKPASRTLEYLQGHGFLTKTIENTHLMLGQGAAGAAALHRKTIITDLAQAGDAFTRVELSAAEEFAHHVAVPLSSKGRVEGVLEIFQRRRLPPQEEWLDFLNTLAGQTAIAIDNSALFEDLQRSVMELAIAYDATIEGWSRAMDLRDRETEGHTRRVTETAMVLARELGFTDEELAHVRRGALLHDIGKMGVSDAVLLKPGSFTPEERAEMERHPQFAYDMLSPIAFLRPALSIPYGHHERWDGTGYPRGLKGDQIPLAARLFAVVDVWDALRSDRPYRKAWTDEDARAHIIQGAGSHFDPQIVDVFIALLDSGTFDAALQAGRR